MYSVHVHQRYKHVTYSFHGFFASFLKLFGWGVDGLIENSKYLISLVWEVVACSQGSKTTHLEGEK